MQSRSRRKNEKEGDGSRGGRGGGGGMNNLRMKSLQKKGEFSRKVNNVCGRMMGERGPVGSQGKEGEKRKTHNDLQKRG